DTSAFQRLSGCTKSQVTGGFTIDGNMALLDTGARANPLVAGVDEFLQIGIGQYAFGQRAASGDDACVSQSGSPFASGSWVVRPQTVHQTGCSCMSAVARFLREWNRASQGLPGVHGQTRTRACAKTS